MKNSDILFGGDWRDRLDAYIRHANMWRKFCVLINAPPESSQTEVVDAVLDLYCYEDDDKEGGLPEVHTT